MKRIVISYRRADSAGITGRIFDHLEAHFGRDCVFMDIDNIPLGSDFRDHIVKILKSCDVLLAIIGPRWLDEANAARLNDATDWVRIEIEAALAKKIPVIPVLIDQTQIPQPATLPEDLRELAFRQATRVDSGIDFRPHMERLIRALDECINRRARASVTPDPVSPVVKPAGDRARISAPNPPARPPTQESTGPSFSDARRQTPDAGGRRRGAPGFPGQVEIAGNTIIKTDDFREQARAPASRVFSAEKQAAAADIAAPDRKPDLQPPARPQPGQGGFRADHNTANISMAGVGDAPLDSFRSTAPVADSIGLREQVARIATLTDGFLKSAANAMAAPFTLLERRKTAAAVNIPAVDLGRAPSLSVQLLHAVDAPIRLVSEAVTHDFSGSGAARGYLEKVRGLVATKRQPLIIGAVGLLILSSVALVLLPSDKAGLPPVSPPLPPVIHQDQPSAAAAPADAKRTALAQPNPLTASPSTPNPIAQKPVIAAPVNPSAPKSQPGEKASNDGAQATDNMEAAPAEDAVETAPAAPKSAANMTADEIAAAFAGTWKFDSDPLQGWVKGKESGWKSFTIAKISGGDLKVTGDFPSPSAVCDYDFDTGHIDGSKVTMGFVCSYIVGSSRLMLEANLSDPTHIDGITGKFQRDGIDFPAALIKWTATKQ